MFTRTRILNFGLTRSEWHRLIENKVWLRNCFRYYSRSARMPVARRPGFLLTDQTLPRCDFTHPKEESRRIRYCLRFIFERMRSGKMLTNRWRPQPAVDSRILGPYVATWSRAASLGTRANPMTKEAKLNSKKWTLEEVYQGTRFDQ